MKIVLKDQNDDLLLQRDGKVKGLFDSYSNNLC